MEDAARLVAGEVVGYNSANFTVAGKIYIATPPTIRRLCGAFYFLSDIRDTETLRDMLLSLGDTDRLCSALSFLVAGDESLKHDLMEGTVDEVIAGLGKTFDLIGIENFQRLSSLMKSARTLTARQKR